ncbi:MAG: formylmethanofuran dehydrogenase subunit C [Burkholderiaceae bacterium]|jgi:formylmethanofuran dehydrogenase subunit C
MSALVLTLKEEPQAPLDLSCLVPDHLASLSLEQIRALPLRSGNSLLRTGELFSVSGTPGEEIILPTGSRNILFVGAFMTRGVLHVEGNVGSYAGCGMRGGTLRVRGQAGDFAASGMTGGLLIIEKDCGDFLAAARPGDAHGMGGGTAIVLGSAGARIAHRMRRGQVLVGGNAGVYCAARMLAGTVMVLGSCAAHLGFAMQRGTLILSSTPLVSESFADCGLNEFTFLRLMARDFASRGVDLAAFSPRSFRARRWVGDFRTGGAGEILLPS